MKFSNPATRSMLLFITFLVILLHIFWSWVFARFIFEDAQYRLLKPEYYDIQVITADDYVRLADISLPKVTLSNGSTFEKGPTWHETVLPNYKLTADKENYVLVTTLGTGHILQYLEPTLLLIGTLTLCGLGLSVWNLSRLKHESNLPEVENGNA